MAIEAVAPSATRSLERDGFVLMPDVLSADRLLGLIDAVHRVWWRHRDEPPTLGAPALHLLGFLREDPRFFELLDLSCVLELIVELLGPNIFMYHCHLDVHPPESMDPSIWRWHQDGGVQNRDLETDPRPRLSLKVAYFLSDVAEPGRGNFMVVPGSHRWNRLERPPDGHEVPGAMPILAAPGDAVVFDRRLWHMRSPNRSAITRKALFYAYSYRWVRARDDLRLSAAILSGLSPVHRQLVGLVEDPIEGWMPDQVTLPVRDAFSRERVPRPSARPTRPARR